ncbi:MAG: hypothetical protein K8R59_14245 [Thermoanaerobaculales bacterium]|nr:hypothetical protein [Thermoanaerobaculales bacterium]
MSHRLTVPFTALLWVGAAVVHATTLGPEIVVSALDNEQGWPAVAFAEGPDEYLVVWHNRWGGDYYDIYAQRISAEGTILTWFSIASLPNDSRWPAVAYDPSRDRYLVVWSYDSLGDGSDWDVRGRFIPRLGPDPSLTDFTLDSGSGSQVTPKTEFALAQDEFMVVWTNEYQVGPPDIAARRVFADGSGFPDSRFQVSGGVNPRLDADIAYNLARNEFLIAFQAWVPTPVDSFEIHGVRMTATGVILGGGELEIATLPSDDTQPAVASCHELDGYLVAWSSFEPDIYARFVTGDGVLDGPPIHIEDNLYPDQLPDVACSLDGARYLVAWQTEYAFGLNGVWARDVMPSHVAGPPFRIVVPTSTSESTAPAVAGGAGGFMITWEHEREGTSYVDIHARTADPGLFQDGFESGDTTHWSSVVP